MRLLRILFVSIILTTFLSSVGESNTVNLESLVSKDLKEQAPEDQPLEYSSTWIVVNMFTGRTSRQAELVRDIMVRLGAPGHGIVLPYKDITIENMKKLKPAFLVLSPNGIPWCKYKGKNGAELEAFFKALPIIAEEMNVPMMGICGGHQAIALAFGGKVGPIRGGEDDCLPYGNNPTERGRHNITVTSDDPLFENMGKTLNLVQNHYDEVKKAPVGFVCLAENRLCKYQIIKHQTKPVYGVQAHTEYYLKNRPDGGILLKNFLTIADEHNKAFRMAEPHTSETKTKAGKSNNENHRN